MLEPAPTGSPSASGGDALTRKIPSVGDATGSPYGEKPPRFQVNPTYCSGYAGSPVRLRYPMTKPSQSSSFSFVEQLGEHAPSPSVCRDSIRSVPHTARLMTSVSFDTRNIVPAVLLTVWKTDRPLVA